MYSLGDGVVFPQRVLDEDTDQLLGGRQRWSEDESPTHSGNLYISNTGWNCYFQKQPVEANAKQVNAWQNYQLCCVLVYTVFCKTSVVQ